MPLRWAGTARLPSKESTWASTLRTALPHQPHTEQTPFRGLKQLGTSSKHHHASHSVRPKRMIFWYQRPVPLLPLTSFHAFTVRRLWAMAAWSSWCGCSLLGSLGNWANSATFCRGLTISWCFLCLLAFWCAFARSDCFRYSFGNFPCLSASATEISIMPMFVIKRLSSGCRFK